MEMVFDKKTEALMKWMCYLKEGKGKWVIRSFQLCYTSIKAEPECVIDILLGRVIFYMENANLKEFKQINVFSVPFEAPNCAIFGLDRFCLECAHRDWNLYGNLCEKTCFLSLLHPIFVSPLHKIHLSVLWHVSNNFSEEVKIIYSLNMLNL